MAISSAGKSVSFTAVNEATKEFSELRELIGLSFAGVTGMTAGQILIVREGFTVGSGTVLARYVIEATDNDNADLWQGQIPVAVRGLSIDNSTVAGTWTLVALFR